VTAVGAPIDPAPDGVEAAFASAADLAERAERVHGTAVDEVRAIGGIRLRIRIVGRPLADALLPALAHHPRHDPGTGHDVEIRAWDASSTDGDLPWFPLTALDGGTSGAARIEAGRRGPHRRLRYQPDERALSLYDPHADLALWCVADPAALPYWERGAPLRALFHWIMEDHGRALVHAAAVGRPDGGLLIVGRGGSGKSTTALSCVGRGLGYLSDDYCIVDPGPPEPRAHSLYSSAKLHHHQLAGSGAPAGLAHLAAWVDATGPGPEGDDKALLFVAEHATDGDLVPTFPIRAVVVPTITGGTTTFGPTTAGAALGALAPSSVLKAPGGGAGALALLAGLVRAVPCIELRLGPDLAALPAHLARLLDQLDADRTP
jgi:hypothetical protein